MPRLPGPLGPRRTGGAPVCCREGPRVRGRRRLRDEGGLAGPVRPHRRRGRGGGGGAVGGASGPPAGGRPRAAAASPPPAHAPPAPEAPRLAGTASHVDEQRKRQYERFLAAFAEIEALFREGKTREALAALDAIRARDAEFLKEPTKAAFVARLERAVAGLERARVLEEALLAAQMTDGRRASLDRRLAASAEVLARAGNDADLDQLTRHLKRFLLEEPASATSKDPADQVFRAFVADRRKRRDKDANPSLASAEEAEKRRVDQLEKLRQ